MDAITPFAMASPSVLLWAIPFVGLLLTIALLPLAAPHQWHRHYEKWAGFWALVLLVPALVLWGAGTTLAKVIETALHEYLPFILLLGSLFAVTGGIHITGTVRGRPAINTALLALGTVLASFIGTTGAALLLIRPVIRANRHRRRKTHLFVYFIVLIANVGGALSPLGDPPLLLGYLQGVPFFWPLLHLWPVTAVVVGGLLANFYAIDHLMLRREGDLEPKPIEEFAKFRVEGQINILLLFGIIATLLLANSWHPAGAVAILGVEWGLGEILRDLLLIAIGLLSLRLTKPQFRRANEFSWEPMAEVAILFAAIFLTLIPVMALIAAGSAGPASPLVAALNSGGAPDNVLYFAATGLLSAFLDNAPTYLVFFGFAGGDAAQLTGPLAPTLAAISAGAVYFGALSYIGNAPNLMVKSVVESQGISMPSFFSYIGWAGLALAPWLVIAGAVFLR